MGNKEEILKGYGIEVFDGNSECIFLQYNNLKIPYNTNNYLFFSTDYFINDVFKIFKIDRYSIDKERILNDNKIFKGKMFDYCISLCRDGITKLYDINKFKYNSVDEFFIDMCLLFGIDTEKKTTKIVNDDSCSREDRELYLATRLEKIRKSFNKLGITKNWMGSKFILYRHGKKLPYPFDDYVSLDVDILIADIVNKFNNIGKSDIKDVKEKIDFIVKNEDSITERKLNIKQILKDKGFYDK